jgi:hypothetical protein
LTRGRREVSGRGGERQNESSENAELDAAKHISGTATVCREPFGETRGGGGELHGK